MKKTLLTVCLVAMTVFVMAQQFNYTPNAGGSPSFTGDQQNAPFAACDSEKGYYDFPFTENGITVTGSGTGSYTVYGPGWSSCGILAKANCVWIGANSGGPATFTNTFSAPVNNMIYNISASDFYQGVSEIITITTNGGTPTITYTDGTCPGSWSISGNVMTCLGFDAGGRFLVTAPSDFTSITFSHNGENNGTTMTMCFDQVLNPPPPVVPVSNWALLIGGVMIATFVFVRYRKLN